MPASDTLEEAALVHVTDEAPGIRRRRAGRGFTYRDPKGRKVTDEAVLARIRGLAIPPAWTDVWICTDPAGHLQATGRDARHRKQYRYHPAWSALRDAAKFSGLSDFGRHLPDLRQTIDADLRRPLLSRERVLATVVRLLDRTLIRIGNDVYATENKSYGLTTLRARHLDLQGTQMRFRFKGKSGQEWSLQVADRRVANTVRQLQDLPGQRLFRYLDAEGTPRDVQSHDVNAYMRAAMGEGFTSKHFRTWGATVQAATALEQTPRPDSQRQQTLVLNQMLDRVAGNLRHTRTVCRNCYVHPHVITAWQQGLITRQMRAIRSHLTRSREGLDLDEEVVLRWLDRHESSADLAQNG
jgi:DNA topoisomerase I